MTNLDVVDRDPLRVGLFVDFENVYLALMKRDDGSHHRLVNRPGILVDHIRNHLKSKTGRPVEFKFLKVYIGSGKWYDRGIKQTWKSVGISYRHFEAAGFTVVEAVALVAEKNAADMMMVIDTVADMLGDDPITGLVILTGDSDFTPLLDFANGKTAYTCLLMPSESVAWRFRSSAQLSVSVEKFLRMLELKGESAQRERSERSISDLITRYFDWDHQSGSKRDKDRQLRSLVDELDDDQVEDLLRQVENAIDSDDFWGFGDLGHWLDARVQEGSEIAQIVRRIWLRWLERFVFQDLDGYMKTVAIIAVREIFAKDSWWMPLSTLSFKLRMIRQQANDEDWFGFGSLAEFLTSNTGLVVDADWVGVPYEMSAQSD